MDSNSHPLLYDKLENLIAILDMAYQVKETNRLKQEWTLEFYHPQDSASKWALLDTECVVEVKGEKYVLKVVEPDDSKGGIVFHCQGEHVSTQTLDWYIDPDDDATYSRTSNLLGVTAQTALQNALAGSRFTLGSVTVTGVLTTSTADAAQGATTINVGSVSGLANGDVIQIGSTQAVISSISGLTITFSLGLYSDQPSGTSVGKNIHDIDMQERNLTDVLREIETTWNGELQWSNRTVSFVPKMGQANGVTFRYQKNNKEIKRSTDTRNFCTRLYGYGSGGVTIQSINSGIKYLDASNINDYPKPIALKKDYSNIDDPESLYQAMKMDLATLSQPKITYELSVVELARVAGYPYSSLDDYGLGDTVTVIDERLNNVSVVSRIYEYERYPYEPQLSRVQIQSLINTTYDQMMKAHSGVNGLLQTVNVSPRRNGRLLGTVGNPASPAQSISHITNTDGTVTLNIQWSFTEDVTSPIDGFGILVHEGTTNAAYTFPQSVTADANHVVDKSVRGWKMTGPADAFYTIAVYPYRSVDPDINSAGLIKGGNWYVNGGSAYQPSTVPNFTGNVFNVPGDSISKTPTTFVIADGSTSHNTKRADYVVPAGATNADVTIQNAINALPSSGGKIVLLDGTFKVSASISVPSNVSIEGQGSSTVISPQTSSSVFINKDSSDSNIHIFNLSVNGGHAIIYFTEVSDCIFDHIYVQNAGSYGIYLVSSSNNKISNCIFTNCYQGVMIYSGSSNSISNNTVTDSRNNGIEVSPAATNATPVNNNLISGNYVSSSQSVGIMVSDVNQVGCSNNIVSGNTVTGNGVGSNGGHGIVVELGFKTIITNNTVSNNIGHGIYTFGGAGYNVISGNIINDNNDSGIYIYCTSTSGGNCNIVGNHCYENNQGNGGYDNITLFSYANYNNIQNNVCRAGSLTNKPVHGINISDSTCTGNVVTNNDLYTSGSSSSLNDAGTGTISAAGNRL